MAGDYQRSPVFVCGLVTYGYLIPKTSAME